MLKPSTLSKGDIIAMNRAYIDYEKFELLIQRGVIYVTKMKKNLKYTILSEAIYQTTDGLMEVGLATMVQITRMCYVDFLCYVDFFSMFNNPEKEWKSLYHRLQTHLQYRLWLTEEGLSNEKLTRTP